MHKSCFISLYPESVSLPLSLLFPESAKRDAISHMPSNSPINWDSTELEKLEVDFEEQGISPWYNERKTLSWLYQ